MLGIGNFIFWFSGYGNDCSWHAHSSLIKIGGELKKFGEKSVGEGQTILILEAGGVLCGVNFSRGGQRIFGENGKLHNNSIKNNYSNLF